MSHHGVFAEGHVVCGGGAFGDVLGWLVFLHWRIKVLQLLFVCDDSGFGVVYLSVLAAKAEGYPYAVAAQACDDGGVKRTTP